MWRAVIADEAGFGRTKHSVFSHSKYVPQLGGSIPGWTEVWVNVYSKHEHSEESGLIAIGIIGNGGRSPRRPAVSFSGAVRHEDSAGVGHTQSMTSPLLAAMMRAGAVPPPHPILPAAAGRRRQRSAVRPASSWSARGVV